MKRGDTISTFKALFLINTLPFNPNSGSVLANPILFFSIGEKEPERISPLASPSVNLYPVRKTPFDLK